MWTFPNIDPVAFQIGPLAVRWYGLTYLLGFVGGSSLRAGWPRARPRDHQRTTDGALSYVAIGVCWAAGWATSSSTICRTTWPTRWRSFPSGRRHVVPRRHARRRAGGMVVRTQAGVGVLPRRPIASSAPRPWVWVLAGSATSSTASSTGVRRTRRGGWSSREAVRCRATLSALRGVSGRSGAAGVPGVAGDAGPVARRGHLAFIGGYGLVRFAVEFFPRTRRPSGLAWGLSRGQYLSAAMMVAAAVFLWMLYRRSVKPAR